MKSIIGKRVGVQLIEAATGIARNITVRVDREERDGGYTNFYGVADGTEVKVKFWASDTGEFIGQRA